MGDVKTVNIAIIEDDDNNMRMLCEYFDRYASERSMVFGKHTFGYATEFLEKYSANYDIVFMDIQLPDLDGMSAAKKLREKDGSVVLVFVTNFAQYAVNGYEVNAADFIVKPVEYSQFTVKLDRIIKRINALTDITIPVKTEDGIISVSAASLKYVEVMGHGLVYHTTHGDYSAYGSLYKTEERLAPAHFVRCNNCYLVNPRYVKSVGNYTTVVGDDELKISYSKRKEYREAIAKYLGGLV